MPAQFVYFATMNRRKIIKKLLWYGLSIVLFWNVLIAVRAWRFTHFSDRKDISSLTASRAGLFDGMLDRFKGKLYIKSANLQKPALPYETLSIQTADALTLEAWHLKTANSKGTVALFHGLQGAKQDMLAEAYGLVELGYDVLLTDFRAHGGSEGNQCTLGMNEAEDVKACFNWLQQQGEKNIILYGASMGAASISRAISKYNLVPQKVILDMPFSSYEQLIQKWFHQSRYPDQPTAKLFTFWAGVLNRNWLFAMKPVKFVKDIQCPVLLQWGRNDQLVPGDATQKIFFNIASVKKRMVVYEQSGHESFCRKEPALWKQQVASFLSF
jgi:uncharacterized protein